MVFMTIAVFIQEVMSGYLLALSLKIYVIMLSVCLSVTGSKKHPKIHQAQKSQKLTKTRLGRGGCEGFGAMAMWV
jgi:hypothetical protein